MKSRFVWIGGALIVLLCVTLGVQNTRLAGQIAGLRKELEKKNVPVIVSREISASEIDPEELDRLRKAHSELLRLRNKAGLLQNKLTELNQQIANISTKPEPAGGQHLPIDNRTRSEGLMRLNEQLISSQRELEKEKLELFHLARSLNASGAEKREVAIADLNPDETLQLQSYFDLKRDFENRSRVVEALKQKLEAEGFEISGAP